MTLCKRKYTAGIANCAFCSFFLNLHSAGFSSQFRRIPKVLSQNDSILSLLPPLRGGMLSTPLPMLGITEIVRIVPYTSTSSNRVWSDRGEAITGLVRGYLSQSSGRWRVLEVSELSFYAFLNRFGAVCSKISGVQESLRPVMGEA